MERTQFTFYESFQRAVARIKKKSDRCDAYDAICNYALYGVEPELDTLPAGAAIAFELSRPNLDASRRKAASGKKGGQSKQGESKPEAKGKQTPGKKENENEIEKENEIENECCYPLPPTTEAAEVFSDFLDRVNPSASQRCLDELAGYVKTLGAAVCKRAFDIALDDKKANWSYIRAILADKQARGVRCLADWDAAEEKRCAEKSAVRGKKSPNNMAGVDFNPTAQRIRENGDWLDRFLEEQEARG